MDDDLRHTDDISQLWGADDNVAWEPAPLHRPGPPTAGPHAGNGNGNGSAHTDRLDALERDVHALVQMVERVEALVDERLGRLERQVEELAGRDQRAGPKGIGRLSEVIKSARSH